MTISYECPFNEMKLWTFICQIFPGTVSHRHLALYFVCGYHLQEKHHQNLEHQRQLQELAFIKEEKRQLGRELEALRSKDRRIREWTSRLELILHKVKHIHAFVIWPPKTFGHYSNIVLSDLTFKILIINFTVQFFVIKASFAASLPSLTRYIFC